MQARRLRVVACLTLFVQSSEFRIDGGSQAEKRRLQESSLQQTLESPGDLGRDSNIVLE